MKIAVLGSGDMGRAHLSAYSKDERVEIAGVTGRTSASARALANQFDIGWSTDPMKFIEDDSIDAVDIALPTALHRRYAELAMEQGKHVLVESPMALDLSEAESMIETANERRLILMVAECSRFMPERVVVHHELERGDLGRPLEMFSSRLSAPYWGARDFSVYGDPILEKMVHEFDLFNWTVGAPVIVECKGEGGASGQVERALVQLWTGDGVHGVMELNANMPVSYPGTLRFRIQTEEATYESETCFAGGEREISLTRYPSSGRAEEMQVENTDPYQEECTFFISCLERNGDPSLLGPKDAMMALQVAKAALESHHEGRPVTLRKKQAIMS